MGFIFIVIWCKYRKKGQLLQAALFLSVILSGIINLVRDSFCTSFRFRKDRDRYGLRVFRREPVLV